jgi:ABC-2 type transport system permease protein
MPDRPVPYLLGAVSLLVGITVSFASAYLVAIAGFWLVETRGVQILYMVISGFLAGLFVPISLFPEWLRITVAATPFPSMMMYPVDVLSGRVSDLSASWLVAEQFGWLVALMGAGAVFTRAGRHKLEVQGG